MYDVKQILIFQLAVPDYVRPEYANKFKMKISNF